MWYYNFIIEFEQRSMQINSKIEYEISFSKVLEIYESEEFKKWEDIV